MIAEPRRNIELKARDRSPAQTLAACEAHGAEARGVLIQRDTYFFAPHGRLKLRQESEGAPHLIAYERPNRSEQRESRYRVVFVDDADALKAALGDSLGIKAVVAKTRRLLIWESVRIHLDLVEGLGHFIEFEAEISAGTTRPRAEARVTALREAVQIEDADLVGGSYCDLASGGADLRL